MYIANQSTANKAKIISHKEANKEGARDTHVRYGGGDRTWLFLGTQKWRYLGPLVPPAAHLFEVPIIPQPSTWIAWDFGGDSNLGAGGGGGSNLRRLR